GSFGWVTDRSGYRYDALDPDSGQPWPAMPPRFRELAERAAGEVGFAGFAPDACLINRYEPGAKMSLHQDRDERDNGAPIVSVSLGLPATFLFGGLKRADKTQRYRLAH
ncbi:alpha-ketoglutarate-dependent dioxygenase AlkB, partial [Serratia marcescens]|nr:alpha-ketoglutarate-dependent dioxygenase AlkB [Serratia marcescens]